MDSIDSMCREFNLSAARTFAAKPQALQRRICEALYLLQKLRVPLAHTARRMERQAMAFMAVADINETINWSQAKDIASGRSMKSRDIITYWNAHFGENVSPGSYDDVRRQDLEMATAAGIVTQTRPDAARNAPDRGYALAAAYMGIVRSFGQAGWEAAATEFIKDRPSLAERLTPSRHLETMPVQVDELEFGPGEHNRLQKAIIEEFLPLYGYGAEVLYVGDAENRYLLYKKAELDELGFFELGHGELPDVVAYSAEKKWLYVIEAVASVGPIDSMRKLKLDELTATCKVPIVYVTAFLTREAFRKNAANIAWETEVWIAGEPEHMIHFDGSKFLGPYRN